MKREIDNSKIISEEHEKFYRFIEGLNLRLGLIKNEIKRRKKIKMSYAEKFIYQEAVDFSEDIDKDSFWVKWNLDGFRDKVYKVGGDQTEYKKLGEIWDNYHHPRFKFSYISFQMEFFSHFIKSKIGIENMESLKGMTESFLFNYKWNLYCHLNNIDPYLFNEIALEDEIEKVTRLEILDDVVTLHDSD